jgi:hypothetical protein
LGQPHHKGYGLWSWVFVKDLLLQKLLSFTHFKVREILRVIFWHPVTLMSYFNLCQCTLSVLNAKFIFRNIICSTILVLLSISAWFMPNCYLWSLFNVYSFLHEPCFTFAQLQCLAWIHLTQDVSTKNGHSGNNTKHSHKDSKCYDLCCISLKSLVITNTWCYQHRPTFIHQLIDLQIWHHPDLA